MKKFLASILVLLMVFSILPAGIFPVYAATGDSAPFAGGSGTESDPYLIETKEQLNNVRNDLDAHYKMIADIVFLEEDFAKDGPFYNGGQGWNPVGTKDDPFLGVFDGNGYLIKKLYISYAGNISYVGLFGCNEGTIINLSLIDADIYARGLVGGVDSNTRVYVGAIAGYSGGDIWNCCSFGSVYATARNWGSTSASYYKAEVYAGGIVGSIGQSGTVDNCYNNSSVTAEHSMQPYPHAGGIAGCSNGVISRSYNLGKISSTLSGESGGIVGELFNFGENTNCYYLENMAKGVGVGTDNCTKCTLASMSNQDTYIGFDFTNVWGFDNSFGYQWPILRDGSIPTLNYVLNSISITSKPHKLIYLEGEDFDPAGMVVTAYYNNDISAEVTDYSVSGYSSSPGIKTIVVTHAGKTASFTVEVIVRIGWHWDNAWYYYNTDGTLATGWLYDGAWYYMDANGVMLTGWVYDGAWYYMNSSGAMMTGWVNDGGTWYYMNSSGAMMTGWVNDGGTWYYMNSGGAMQTGWVNDGGMWYYMNAGGAMHTGWLLLGNTWYYMTGSGAMATGWVYDGAWYYMDASGAWVA